MKTRPAAETPRCQMRDLTAFPGEETTPMIMIRWSTRLTVTSVMLVMAIAVACGSGEATSSAPAPATLNPPGSTVSPADTAVSSPEPTPFPTPTEVPTPDPIDAVNREAYTDAAGTAVVIIRQSALVLSGLGLQLSGKETIPASTRSTVEVARDTIQLALDSMAEIPVPAGLEPLAETINASASHYIVSANVILDHTDGIAFDFFDFQRPFSMGGENFHAAGSLLGDAKTAR
ncbi:MAG: hypothetical protein IIC93_07290 [Chloroflexi bacterium]|nr:hypothetical protein [Chloroflexota bacterium]